MIILRKGVKTMKRLFGTDGIRGIANKNLTGDLAYKVGLATAKLLTTNRFRNAKNSPFEDENPIVLIGTDTRPSKDLIFSGLACGLTAGGVNVITAGILPTPAIAYLTKNYEFVSAGIMVTASHNPKEYNGIKIIGPDGYKLHDNLEEQIEDLIANISDETIHSFYAENPGRISYDFVKSAKCDYTDFLNSLFSFNIHDSDKLRVAVDCSNGAASPCKNIFKSLGINADIYNINESGEKINDGCGSMHLEYIAKIVKDGLYDCGIAFDGDADRCLLVDENGDVVDGDYILAIIGSYLKEHNKLTNNTIVGTIMSNLGLVKFCESNDIKFCTTKVGDKYVLEEMITNNSSLGGEQSGHIILKDYATTGDGLLTALMVLYVMCKTEIPLSILKQKMKKYPQVSTQITAGPEEKNAFVANSQLKDEINKLVYDKLGSNGRAVVRPSGTENCIRIMVEGEDEKITKVLCEAIKGIIISSI